MYSDFPAPTKQALGFSLDIPANRVSSYKVRRSGNGCQEGSRAKGWKVGGLQGSRFWGGDQTPPKDRQVLGFRAQSVQQNSLSYHMAYL